MMVSMRLLLYTAAVLLACSPAARAGVIISVGNVSMAAGSSGWVPVYLSSDPGTTTNLASTNFEFRITTTGSSRLEFTNSPEPASDPTFSSGSNYLFSTNSGDQTFGIPLGNVSEVSVPNDTFIGGDFYLGAGDVSVPATSPILTDNLLLADLPVTTLTSLAPVAGDTFIVSLVPLASSAIGNPTGLEGNTGFADSGGDFYSFISSPGIVTIIPAAVVPEPASFGLMLAGAIGMLSVHRRKSARRIRSPSKVADVIQQHDDAGSSRTVDFCNPIGRQ